MDWIYGAWTYRSFYNREEPAETITDIVLAEGEMVFETALPGEIAGQLAFRSPKPDRTDPILTFAGSLEEGSPATARFRGTGLAGTGAEGWVYDYVGYLVPHWPGGKGQKTAMVGSVTRLVDHPGSGGTVRHAGDVYSFVAVRRDFPEAKTIIPIAEPVLAMLASRGHRLHHLLWHTLRNSWTDESSITPAIKKEITKLGWAPPRPVLSPAGDPLFGNGSGEDFLFMHRQMVIEVNDGLKKARKPPIEPWATIPPPGPVVIEPDYHSKTPVFTTPGNPQGFSVPPAWVPPDNETMSERLASLKTADFYWSRMRWWDRQYKDPAYLSTLTLGELGTLLEWTVHNDMHMRWASVPRDPRTNEVIPQGRPDWDIDKAWDSPQYDHLGEQYSSHVHPVFWRLHGWVDNRIDDWFAAHEVAHPGQVKRVKVMGTPWFEGKKWVQVDMPWTGPMDMHGAMKMAPQHGGHGSDDDVKTMERIIALILPPPKQPKKAKQPKRAKQPKMQIQALSLTVAVPRHHPRPNRRLRSQF
jgi:hypothetical protein